VIIHGGVPSVSQPVRVTVRQEQRVVCGSIRLNISTIRSGFGFTIGPGPHRSSAFPVFGLLDHLRKEHRAHVRAERRTAR